MGREDHCYAYRNILSGRSHWLQTSSTLLEQFVNGRSVESLFCKCRMIDKNNSFSTNFTF